MKTQIDLILDVIGQIFINLFIGYNIDLSDTFYRDR